MPRIRQDLTSAGAPSLVSQAHAHAGSRTDSKASRTRPSLFSPHSRIPNESICLETFDAVDKQCNALDTAWCVNESRTSLPQTAGQSVKLTWSCMASVSLYKLYGLGGEGQTSEESVLLSTPLFFNIINPWGFYASCKSNEASSSSGSTQNIY